MSSVTLLRFARVLVVTGLAPLLALSFLFFSSQRADLEAVAKGNLARQARLQAAAVRFGWRRD
jgi:hypothetical protein